MLRTFCLFGFFFSKLTFSKQKQEYQQTAQFVWIKIKPDCSFGIDLALDCLQGFVSRQIVNNNDPVLRVKDSFIECEQYSYYFFTLMQSTNSRAVHEEVS